MLKSKFFPLKNFNVFYDWRAPNKSGKASARTNCTEKKTARNEKNFYLWGKMTVVLSKKEERTHWLWSLSSSLYKYTTISREKQIALTFRNTSQLLKMQRFPADGVWRVLYCEAHLEGWHPSARKRGAEGCIPIRFVIEPFFLLPVT